MTEMTEAEPFCRVLEAQTGMRIRMPLLLPGMAEMRDMECEAMSLRCNDGRPVGFCIMLASDEIALDAVSVVTHDLAAPMAMLVERETGLPGPGA